MANHANIKKLIEKNLNESRGIVTESEAKEILQCYRIPVNRGQMVNSTMEAVQAVAKIQFPIVLKIVSPDIPHKTEAGGVKTGLTSSGEVEQAYHEIMDNAMKFKPDANILGISVQEMVPPGQEVFVGIKRNSAFGPILTFGLGGIWVELIKDVAIRAFPIDRQDILNMVDELRGGQLLKGFRGGAPMDIEAIIDIVLRVAKLAEDYPEIYEMDLNPVIVSKSGLGATVVDARIILKEIGVHEERHFPANRTQEMFESLFRPQSIAVVGASADETKNGGRLIKYIVKHGYQGKLFPINPTTVEILGHRCYATIKDVPSDIDLACIIVPAKGVPSVMQDCVIKGVKAAIVHSSGFAEVGEEGKRLENEVLALAREGGIRLAGPNTVGIVSPVENTYTSFGMAMEVDNPVVGKVAFVTQSGALGGALVSRAWEQNIGISRWIAAGNDADLNISDYVNFLATDPHTGVICIFMEGVEDGQKFKQSLEIAANARKPVIIYKTGRSELGGKAVQSHTGTLAGDDKAYSAIFNKLGVIRVPLIWDLLDAASGFACLPIPKGNRVGIVTTSGGLCSMLADYCSEAGLNIIDFPEELQKEMEKYIPSFGSARNPVDVTAQVLANPEIFKKTLEVLVGHDIIDAIIIGLTTSADPVASKVAQAIVDASRQSSKPFLIIRMGAEFLAPKALSYFAQQNVPVYPTPDRAVKVLEYMVGYAKFLAQKNLMK